MFHQYTSLEYSGKNFFVKMKLGMDFNISFVTVPIEVLVHPLCVIPDCGGDNNIYFVVLLKCKWSQFFGKELSSLQTFKYCKCVRENRNIRGHQQCTIASD
jgi:hypothetical protein